MSEKTSPEDAQAFYVERYTVVARYQLAADTPTFLVDHSDASDQRCRFCNQTRPQVSFRNRAHAVPAFLGNKSLFSRNECNGCNKRLADEYEDHLSKWSLLARSVSRVSGRKRGGPTYADDEIRIEPGETGLHIHLAKQDLSETFAAQTGTFEFRLPSDGESQPHVPLRAALALVRIACSICPANELAQCNRAIDWLMGRVQVETSLFPILYGFTPGAIRDEADEVILLKRTGDDAIPYLWLVVRFANHQFQTFVPLCPPDDHWFKGGQSNTFDCPHYPSRFPDDWPFGKTKYMMLNWAGTEPVKSSATVSFALTPKRGNDS